MKTIGAIGGLGPETTSKFYLRLIEACRSVNNETYPSVVIHSIPLPFSIENDNILRGQREDIDKTLPYLLESAKTLESAGADFGVILCNTVHILIDEVRKSVTIPFLSIIEETVDVAKEQKIKCVAVLGTNNTISSGIYNKQCEKRGISMLVPETEDQAALVKIISHILHGEKSNLDRDRMVAIVKRLQERGAEAIILGCTDLQLLVNGTHFDIPVIDTVEALVAASVKTIYSSFV